MASDDVEANVDRAEESSNQAVAKQNHKVTSNKNKAAKNSNQAVANIIHNLTSVMYGNKQTALVCAIVCVVGLGFGGLLIGLYFRNSHQPTTTSPTSSLAPSQTNPSSGIASSTPTKSRTILPFPTTSSLAPSRTNPPSVMKSSSLTSTTSSTTLPPPSPSPGADGIHLVRYQNGTILGNGFAYFGSAQQGNQGALPDDFAVANVHINGQWEGFNTTGFFTDTGDTISASINQTTSAVNGLAGTASNGHHTFLCYKDNTGFLYKENEIDFYSRYYCQ